MPATTGSNLDAEIWQRVIESNRPLSATAAKAILGLQFPKSDQARMRELAAKARAGALTESEELEAVAYERFGCLLDILHSQARRVLRRTRKAS